MAVFSSLMLIFLLIVCTFSFTYRRSENDLTCNLKGGILCVKDELVIIATIANGIVRKLNETEKYVNINFKRKKNIFQNFIPL